MKNTKKTSMTIALVAFPLTGGVEGLQARLPQGPFLNYPHSREKSGLTSCSGVTEQHQS